MSDALFRTDPPQLGLTSQLPPILTEVGEYFPKISLFDQESHRLHCLHDHFGTPSQGKGDAIAICITIRRDGDVDARVVRIRVL